MTRAKIFAFVLILFISTKLCTSQDESAPADPPAEEAPAGDTPAADAPADPPADAPADPPADAPADAPADPPADAPADPPAADPGSGSGSDPKTAPESGTGEGAPPASGPAAPPVAGNPAPSTKPTTNSNSNIRPFKPSLDRFTPRNKPIWNRKTLAPNQYKKASRTNSNSKRIVLPGNGPIKIRIAKTKVQKQQKAGKRSKGQKISKNQIPFKSPLTKSYSSESSRTTTAAYSDDY